LGLERQFAVHHGLGKGWRLAQWDEAVTPHANGAKASKAICPGQLKIV